MYEVAARVVCYSGGRLSRPGLGVSISNIVTGVLDRVIPEPESYSPSNGIVYDTTTVISASFSEDINCDFPYSFTVTAQPISTGDQNSLLLTGSFSTPLTNFAISCTGSTISLSYEPSDVSLSPKSSTSYIISSLFL